MEFQEVQYNLWILASLLRFAVVVYEFLMRALWYHMVV